jgi:predicted Fe-S protein YdhL (DUF1289 family)
MIKSPCTNICKINPTTQFCEGCKRTIEEIAAWTHYSDKEKIQILEDIKKR